MKKRKVISSRNLPRRSPLVATLVGWLVLDKVGAPGVVVGVVGTLCVLWWLLVAVDIYYSDSVSLFEEEGE